jgi:hypothetical protein
MKRTALLIVFLLPSLPGRAQANHSTIAYFTFMMPLKESKEQFFNGYRRHLDWHRRKQDKLTWYGWLVTSGPRSGLFVDATLNNAWADYRNRVDLAEDIRDNELNVVPFSAGIDNGYWILKKNVSTPWKDNLTAPVLQVYFLYVKPGYEQEFDSYLQKLDAALRAKSTTIKHFVFNAFVGNHLPRYMVIIPCDQLHLDGNENLFTTAITTTYSEKEAKAVLALFRQSVSHYESETWAYKEDLSYFPEK